MNSYSNFRNFNMDPYINNSFNSADNLYNPYNGFIRGNLFKDIYDPYLDKEPYEIKPINEQANMLTNIDALCFALIDLNLYLDVNPNDRNKINLFNKYKEEKEKLTKDYEAKYGPLTLNSDSLNSYPWAWNNMPWPWDN